MTIADLINYIECGQIGTLGTGTKGCKAFLKKVTTIWATPQGFKYDSTKDLDDAYAFELQRDSGLKIFKGIRTFTDNSAEDKMDELDDGTKQVATLGLYEIAVQFLNGLYYHKVIHSHNSFGDYDMIFIDRDGNVLATLAADGSMKGFTVGYLQGAKFSWPTDSTGQREGMMFQLLERGELDNDSIFLDHRKFTDGFNPNKVDGINQIKLAFSPAPAAGTSLTVKATRSDGKPFTGLVFGDFLYTVNGATVPITSGDDSATEGTYVFVVPSFVADDKLTMRIFDSTENSGVILVAGDGYQSNILTATAV